MKAGESCGTIWNDMECRYWDTMQTEWSVDRSIYLSFQCRSCYLSINSELFVVPYVWWPPTTLGFPEGAPCQPIFLQCWVSDAVDQLGAVEPQHAGRDWFLRAGAQHVWHVVMGQFCMTMCNHKLSMHFHHKHGTLHPREAMGRRWDNQRQSSQAPGGH